MSSATDQAGAVSQIVAASAPVAAKAPIMRSISANLFVRHGGGEARRRACGARTPRQDRRAGDSRAATPACG
jgi:hypothetical protein